MPHWLDPYIFCFIDSPYPEEWQKHPQVFETLLRKIGPDLALLSFDVTQADHPQVIDFGPALEVFENGQFTKNLSVAATMNLIQRYFMSLVPFQTYQEGYVLPELLIPKNIERIRLNFEVIPQEIEQLLAREEQLYHPQES